jgi:hypothetical protein
MEWGKLKGTGSDQDFQKVHAAEGKGREVRYEREEYEQKPGKRWSSKEESYDKTEFEAGRFRDEKCGRWVGCNAFQANGRGIMLSVPGIEYWR